MATSYTRKADDNRIMELNSIGMSLTGIAEVLGVHPTTVTYRLKAMGIQPVDTRRSFMESIYDSLTERQKQWLIGQMSAGYSIRDFVRTLIVNEFVAQTTNVTKH